MAMNTTGSSGEVFRSKIIQPPKPTTSTRTSSARERRELCPERQRDGKTPELQLPEDVRIGNGHRSAANKVNANKPSSGNAETVLINLSLITGPFFIEVFSGSGRLAKSVHDAGIQTFEYDLTEKGGRKNLLHANVLHELKAMIAHPMCRGIWFGFPCGTFSSARRNDGGPPPLRGTNHKDIWGLPHLVGKERARVDSANKLLMRMNELMKHCESSLVPFYLENPQMSKLWHHPLIRKWIHNPASQKVEFDYCQFGTEWKKSTTTLSVGNLKFHTGQTVKCKVVWHNGSSICSRTGKPHDALTGFINGAPKGQYKTNKACPYP